MSRTILALPLVYRLFALLIGAHSFRSALVEQYIQAKPSDRILDIGCGPADILDYLPDVEYVGLDLSQKYIESAKKRFGSRGKFIYADIGKKGLEDFSSLDIVMALGVLHHLNDDEALQLFNFAKMSLKSGGKLVTVDGCYLEKQSGIKRYLLSKDRGQYVRTKEQYLGLASQVFNRINMSILDNSLNIPYTHIVLECNTD